MTFRDAEAARRAVQEPNPMITGRRANCNIASLGPPRPAQPRGRASTPGAHLQGPAAQGPHYYARAPQQQQQPQMSLMAPHHGGPAIYHPSQQYGYWYPPDYQYQQAMMNPQVLHNSYAQMYGLVPSPTGPSPYHHQYVGYMPTPSPRAVISPAQQLAAQPYVPLPSTAHIQGSFMQVPSLPNNFALQLPAHAVSLLPPSPADLQSGAGQAYSAASATNPNSTHQGD